MYLTGQQTPSWKMGSHPATFNVHSCMTQAVEFLMQ